MADATRGWGRLGLNHVRMCVCQKVKGMGPFLVQVNEMNQKISFNMGVKFASSSLCWQGFILDVWHVKVLEAYYNHVKKY